MAFIKHLRNFCIDFMIQRDFLGGIVESIDGGKEIIKTESTTYKNIKEIFFELYKIKASDVIIDIGCGKGRVFNYLLYKGVKNDLIGYEINEIVAVKTKKNLSRFKNVKIECKNIFDDFPISGNVFYLFNPFNENMTRQFKDQLLNLKGNDPIVFYFNPKWLEVFNEDLFTYEVKSLYVTDYKFYTDFAIIKIK